MKRWAISLFAALAVLWLLPAGSRAMGFDISGGVEDNSFEIDIQYDGSYGRIDACVFCMDFDSEVLDFQDTHRVTGGYLVNRVENGSLRSVYCSWAQGGGLESASFMFQAVKGADISGAQVRVWVEQVAAPAAVPDTAPVRVGSGGPSPGGNEADLLVLRPSAGELVPEFSPGTTEYRVEVPYSVEEMSFEMSASPGAKVSVNRKNLGSGDSSTPFKLTVTAEDGVTKRVYTVTVHRAAYSAPTPKPTATPRPTGTPKPTVTPKPTRTPKPTATPRPASTPKPTATPKPTKTPASSPTPKPTKTPRPTASPKPGSTSGPEDTPTPAGISVISSGNGPGSGKAPLTEVVTIERKEVGTVDRLLAAGGVLAAALAVAALAALVYEWISRRREEQLRGRKRK